MMFFGRLGIAEDWTRFRGPNGSGAGYSKPVPTTWGDAENITWKMDLPGKGSSCPIVIGDQVIVTCYSGYGLTKENPGSIADLKRHLLCFDRNSGKKIWDKTFTPTQTEDVYEGYINDHGYASSTPATDGKKLFVMFGKSGLYAFDLNGTELWNKNLGTNSDPNKWGNGASPVLYKDLVIINAGIEGHAIVALKQGNGDEVWRINDEKFTGCWSTPILVDVDGHSELVFSMPGKILGVNPDNGERLWSAKSPIDATVCSSPVQRNGVVFAMGGLGGVAIAIKCGGKGDVSETHKLWQQPLRSGIDTPVVVGDHLYWTARGAAFCASCETGELIYKQDLAPRAEAPPGQRQSPTGDYASPVTVGDAIYMVLRSGKTHVFKAGAKFERLGTNEFAGDVGPFNASPAVSDGQLFVRSDSMLYCISSK
jgi:outer membrane protein assembly factor BamB